MKARQCFVQPVQLLLDRPVARRSINLAQLIETLDNVHARLRQYGVTMHERQQKLQQQPALLFGFGRCCGYHSGSGRGMK